MTLRHAPRESCLVPALLALCLAPGPGHGARQDPATQCDRAAAAAAERTGVPIDLLLAISRVETGRGGPEPAPWPWTINADGHGSFYDSKEEAVAAATEHLSDGTGTFDVGCFQLNIRWHGAAFATLDDMFDPVRNAEYAAEFLLQLYQESGDWRAAVSAYHSRTPELADLYLDRVRAVLEGGANQAEDLPPPPAEVVVRENLFPLLQAGGQGSVGSLVPLQSTRGPLIGGNS